MVRVMAESSNCQRLRDELKSIRSELEKLLEALSTDEAAGGEQGAAAAQAPDCGQAKLDFFDQITQGDQLPEGDDLYRKVLTIITTKGYASTLVLQHKLELNYRQASSKSQTSNATGWSAPRTASGRIRCCRPHTRSASASKKASKTRTVKARLQTRFAPVAINWRPARLHGLCPSRARAVAAI